MDTLILIWLRLHVLTGYTDLKGENLSKRILLTTTKLVGSANTVILVPFS